MTTILAEFAAQARELGVVTNCAPEGPNWVKQSELLDAMKISPSTFKRISARALKAGKWECFTGKEYFELAGGLRRCRWWRVK